jgi:hypothetical protein
VFIPVGSLIKNLPRRSKTPEAILALQVRQVAKSILEKVCVDLSRDILDQVKVSSFKNGTLMIVAPTLVCTELQMRSEGLVKEINKTLGKRLVTRLRFRVS